MKQACKDALAFMFLYLLAASIGVVIAEVVILLVEEW